MIARLNTLSYSANEETPCFGPTKEPARYIYWLVYELKVIIPSSHWTHWMGDGLKFSQQIACNVIEIQELVCFSKTFALRFLGSESERSNHKLFQTKEFG